ncbi:MAG: DNA polymerase III subunit beta [Eubacteriales bacterium]
MSIHFKCDRDIFLKGLSTAEKAVELRNIKPILEGVLIQAKDNTITLKATNLSLSIQTVMDGEILEPGEIVVSARVFYEVLSKYAPGTIDFYMEDESRLKISNNHSKTHLSVMDAAEFPGLPIIPENGAIVLKQTVFKKMLNTTIFSAAISDARPILKGVLMETENNTLKIVALDGYRLAFRKIQLEGDVPEIKAIIPSSAFREVIKILDDTDDELSIFLADNIACIKTNKTQIFMRLLEGEFIKYNNILPNEYKSKIKLNKNDIADSVDRASILARSEKDKLVKFNVVDDILTITSASELGEAFEQVDIFLEGKHIDIAFNAKYLADVFKVIEDEDIILEFNTNVSPCVIRSGENDEYLYLVLPVQMR